MPAGATHAAARVVHAAFVRERADSAPSRDVAPDPKVGFEIGWDWARTGAYPPLDLLDNKHFAAGFQSGKRHWKAAPDDDRFVRKWLQLRGSAWRRSRAIAHDVTPDYLRQIDVSHCPITREPLTHGTLADTDASVDRINNALGYCRGNLAVVSTRANRAKGMLDAISMLQLARELDAKGPQARMAGLDVNAWTRLATLTAFGENFADPQVPEMWPLVVMPGPEVAVLHPGFSLKAAVSGFIAKMDPAPMRKLLRGKTATSRYDAFARGLSLASASAGRKHVALRAGVALIYSLEDAWRAPLVNQQWRLLLPVLQDIGVDRVLSADRRLVRPMSTQQLLRAGAAGTRGYVQ